MEELIKEKRTEWLKAKDKVEALKESHKELLHQVSKAMELEDDIRREYLDLVVRCKDPYIKALGVQ